MKRICFLIGNLNNAGGTERVTSIIANNLSKQNYSISILSMIDGTKPFFALENDILTYSLYSKKISFKSQFVGAVWKIRQFVKRNNIDTLIVVDSISCIFTIPALSGFKVKHICWEHFNFNNNNGSILRDIGRKLAARYCDYIVTLTEKDKILWKQNLEVVNAVIISIPNPNPYQDDDYSTSLDYKVMLAVGRLTYVKGFDLLIAAWYKVCQSNNDWTLKIVGNGEEEENLKLYAEKLGLTNRIDFIPATQDINQYYKTSSFYCLSSRFEGLPMVLLEAQSFGLPIIAFDCETGPSEVVKNNKNGFLVDNKNIDMLSEQIITCTNLDKNSYKELSENSKILSLRFSVSNVIKSWNNIL